MQFESTGNISDSDLENLLVDELSRRKAAQMAGGSGIPLATVGAKTVIHQSLLNELMGEFEDIRQDPARRSKEMDQMIRTYDKYLNQGNNPVEIFIPNDQNFWAAGRDPETGDDIVFYDPGAPHAAVMAHELGHVQMNDPSSNDPLSFLQKSGIGRASGAAAPLLGAAGGYMGYNANPKRRFAGSAIGTGIGALLGSGNFAYELGGASGRALGYLPEDADQMDAAGDLLRAGMTYGMAGPGMAIAMGSGIAGSLELSRRLQART